MTQCSFLMKTRAKKTCHISRTPRYQKASKNHKYDENFDDNCNYNFMIGRQSNIVGCVSGGDCEQLRLVVDILIVVLVVLTAGAKQVSTRWRYYVNMDPITPTNDANS